MKLSAAVLLLAAGSAAAFTVPSTTVKSSATLRMVDTPEEMEVAAATPEEPEPAIVAEPPLPEMSASMPFMARPVALDGSLAGDVGFDPLGFAKTKEDLMNYREAEVKHARLAMLAAAGWPLSEVFDKKLAGLFGLAPVLDASDRAPSVLNGGLEKISPIYWVGCILAAGAIDFIGTSNAQKNADGYFAGNYGFDPLGLYPSDAEGQKRMQTAEIKNGRLAMIAISAFAAQEFVTKMGVVDQTPIFFKPLSEALHEYANSGYIH